MIFNRRQILLVLGLAFAITTRFAHGGNDPQISKGVRAMAQVGQGGFGPKGSPFMINRQPPIYPYMASGETRFFDSGADLLAFFQALPADVQQRGLWITRGGVSHLERKEDQERLTHLATLARQKSVLMYDCTPGEHPGGWLVAWECRQRSPSETGGVLRCVPRDKPHLDHPWWDCGGRSVGGVPSAPDTKRIDWTEDVRLSDGRTIVVRRAEEYRRIVDIGTGGRAGWLLERSDISAVLPTPVGRNVSWQGSLHPVVLDIQPQETVYLVGVPANGRARQEWKLPRHELYVVLRLNGEAWDRVPLETLPASIQPNLFVSSYELFMKDGRSTQRYVDLKLKSDLDSNSEIDKRFKTIVRIPAPERK